MSTNTVNPDTTRTNQKSQLVDDPYFHSLHLHHELTTLLDITVFDNKWFSRVSKILNIRKKELTNFILLGKHWKKSWGILAVSAYNNMIIWVRTDDGPEMAQSKFDIRIIVIRYMLMANLSEVLFKLNKSSYEKVGVTKNWRRAKIKFNGKEIENILWADALTGKCAIKAFEEPEKILTGHIDIILQEQNLSFF